MKSILNYHDINRSFSPFFSTISPMTFKKHLAFFKKNSIEIIDFEDYFKKENGIVLTFDDGFKSLYHYLPELIGIFKFKPIIFVVTGFTGNESGWDIWLNRHKHLNESEIRYLSDNGVIFGSHTHNHQPLNLLDEDNLRFELEYSKKLLEDITGKEVTYLSYPFGKFNKRVIEFAKMVGYSNGFVSTPIKFREGDFNVGRWSIYLIDSYFNLRLKNDKGGILSGFEKMKCKIINKFSFLTYYANFNF